MSLLAPLALLGLLTIPVIILLHLLRTRREPMLISNLNLWLGLQQKQQAVMPRYIPITLLLILQLCIAAGLALALARPALSFLVRQPQHITLILDTTTSMAAQDTGQTQFNPQTRFDAAREVALSHLRDMTENDTFAVITLNRRPEVLLVGNSEQVRPALTALDNLTPGGTGLDLPAALTLANGFVDPERQNQIIVLTDGNYNVSPNTLLPMKVPVTWKFIPPQAAADNQALLNVSAQTWPDGRHRLFARIINYADTPVNRTLQLSVNGQPAEETAVELGPNDESARAWTLPASAETVAVEIVEPDALQADNRAELFLTAPSRYHVLLVSDTPAMEDGALARALEAQGVQLAVTPTAALADYDPADFDLLVFDGLPPGLAAWPDGNVLVVNPPLGHPLLPAAEMARELRPDSSTVSSVLTGVDWSGVYFTQAPHLALPKGMVADLQTFPLTADNVTPQILGQQDEEVRHPLIFHGTVGDSRLIVWAFDLNQSNLAGRLALPLLTANTLSLLLSALPPATVPAGEPVLVGDNLSIQTPAGHRLMMPSGSAGGLSQFLRTQQPGLYTVYNQNDQLVGGFGVHAGSALESNLTAQFAPELVAGVNPATVTEPEPVYADVWPWLVGLVAILVAVEGWLAWRK
jgi:hypothetical protein